MQALGEPKIFKDHIIYHWVCPVCGKVEESRVDL